MAELAARHLLNNGIEHIIVANRTYENAVKLAEEFKGAAVPFDELAQQMELADIVISSTGAPTVIIDKKMVKGVIKRRRNKPMFFIDIAVPRDIHPSVNEVENVYAYDIDDLEGVVETNIKIRSKEAAKAEEIVDGEVGQFLDWMRSRESFPTIVALREWAEEVRRTELSKTLKRIDGLSEVDVKRVEAMTEAMLNKILHRPISRMKKAAHQGDEGEVVEMVREIFEIED
jgi:glutamyl-tRNA reductase